MSAWKAVLGVGVALASTGCSEPDETERLLEALRGAATRQALEPEAETVRQGGVNPRLLRRFEPLRTQVETASNPLTSAKVDLGRMLFFDKRLSKGQNVSCNSCHDLARFGVDRQATSPGTDGVRGGRNSPTVYNAAGSFVQFWDGRAQSIEAQAGGPILNPIEMGQPSGEHVVALLKAIPGYVTAFQQAFPGETEPLTFANIGQAIGAFERKLLTPSRWDDFLRGKQDALTQRELEGLSIFTNVGCMVCHTGEFVGGSMFQKVGVVEPWPNQKDQGRYETTKQEGDRMMFKVPTLRNIAETGPYFHDGSVATLDGAVRAMGKHQLGLSLADREVELIVAWLGSLTGTPAEQYASPPTKLPD